MSKVERKLDVIFDYEKQEWFNAAGERLEEESDWVFPCPRCQGPADCSGISAHYEHYECLNCGHHFRVN